MRRFDYPRRWLGLLILLATVALMQVWRLLLLAILLVLDAVDRVVVGRGR